MLSSTFEDEIGYRTLDRQATINIKGDSYRLKDKRKAGIWPQARLRQAAPGVAYDSLALETCQRLVCRWSGGDAGAGDPFQ